MVELVTKLFDKYWLKYRSIPLFFIVCLLMCVPSVPKKPDDSSIQFFFLVGICIVTFLLYCFFCFENNRLPRAKRGTQAVLFVIDAETDQLYNDVKNKLGSSFEDYINSSSHFSFVPVYVQKHKLSHYNFNDEPSMLNLVEKTRTMFVVDIKYRVDDISHAEKYEIRINLGVVHPAFNDAKDKVIQSDLILIQRSVLKKRFVKNHLLEQFDVTAQQLSLICKYIIGLVMLLQLRAESACNLLREAYSLAKTTRSTINDPIYRMIENRFVSACLVCSDYYLELFTNNKELSHLDNMDGLLEEMNSIRPGLPQYYANKAYYEIARNRNSKSAEEFIKQQKSIDPGKTWKYSDAFLVAYDGKSPFVICRKYKNAFKVDYNLVYIVDYIEYILETEPDRFGLFLAAGLVYEELGDNKLAYHYYAKYQSLNKNEKFGSFLQEKLSNLEQSIRQN